MTRSWLYKLDERGFSGTSDEPGFSPQTSSKQRADWDNHPGLDEQPTSPNLKALRADDGRAVDRPLESFDEPASRAIYAPVSLSDDDANERASTTA